MSARKNAIQRACFPVRYVDNERGWADGDEANRTTEIDAMEAARKERWAAMPLPPTGGRK